MDDSVASSWIVRIVWWVSLTLFCVLFTFPFYFISPSFVLTFWLPMIAILSFGSLFKLPNKRILLILFIIAGIYSVVWQRGFGYIQYCERGFFGFLGCPMMIVAMLFVQAIVLMVLVIIVKFRDKMLRFFPLPVLSVFLGLIILPYFLFLAFYNANMAVNGDFKNGSYEYANGLWTGDKVGIFSHQSLNGFREPMQVSRLMAPYSSWQWKGYCALLVRRNLFVSDITNDCYALGALHFNDEKFCSSMIDSKFEDLQINSTTSSPIQYCINGVREKILMQSK